MDHWVDLTDYGLQLRMAQDRGRSEWCVLPAKGYAPAALAIHAENLRGMGFIGDRAGLFHHPVAIDRRGNPRNQPTAELFRAHGFPLARQVAFDAAAHVFRIRAAEPVARDADLDRDVAGLQAHDAGQAGTLGRLMDAAIAYARRHGLDAEEAFREAYDEPPRPPGP